jgi:uncharacterized protein
MIRIEGWKFRLVPILVTILLGFALPIAGAYLVVFAHHFVPALPLPSGPLLPWLYAQHGAQLLLALVAIAIVKYFVPADYGLHLPRWKTYVAPAILWGLFFGVLMTLVDYAPQLIARSKPTLDYPLTTPNVAGWLGFEGLYVGPTEEIPFRALLVTYLAATMPGKLRIGRFDMNMAGIVVALIFALLHAANFSLRAWPMALGQQLYAFALGVLYAYWLEKSKSVLAPMVGHNVSDVTEYAILFAWVAF